jgi:predicted ATPase
MSDELGLTEFYIRGYRGIGHLHLPALGRVTLIAGKNNAGKTSVLEALRVYFSEKPIAVLAELLRLRSGLRQPSAFRRQGPEIIREEIEVAMTAASEMFYGYYSDSSVTSIEIGSAGPASRRITIVLPSNAATLLEDDLSIPADEGVFVGPDTPLLYVASGEHEDILTIETFLRRYVLRTVGNVRATVAYIPPRGADLARLGTLWGHAVTNGYAAEVEDAFRSILPDLERVHVIGNVATQQILAVQLKDNAKPIPLTSMGEGVIRVFGIVLAMVQASGGALLIDEAENGLHHSVQAEVWATLFSLSERLNVQVFATTHSWDAVVGFQLAATNSPSHGMLYRLEREPDGQIYAEQYTERDVAVAAEAQVEVR